MQHLEDFTKPTIVTDVDLAFPAQVHHLMPDRTVIVKSRDSETFRFYSELAERWFFRGLSAAEVPKVKSGLDEELVWRHLGCIMKSFEPKHEHKIDAVAFLMMQWTTLED